MSIKLAPDDIEKDLLVTIFSYNSKTVKAITPNGVMDVEAVNENRFGMGQIFRVLAVDLPYIVVHGFVPTETSNFIMMILDLRDINLMKISKDYALAYIGADNFNKLMTPNVLAKSQSPMLPSSVINKTFNFPETNDVKSLEGDNINKSGQIKKPRKKKGKS